MIRQSLLPLLWAIAVLVATEWYFGFFNPDTIGHDYSYFFPYLLSGWFWWQENGLALPWFTPALCGGIPWFGNPQSMFFSLPQLLVLMTDPLTVSYLSYLLAGLCGFQGMYLLAGVAGIGSLPGRLFCGTAFLLNGAFLSRVMTGHITFLYMMLLPLLVWLLIHRGQRLLAPGLACGVLFAIIIHGGAGVLVVPLGLSLLLGILLADGQVRAARRLGIGLLTGLLLSLGKLTAGLALMQQFPRDLYLLPGYDGLPAALAGTALSLGWPLSAGIANDWLVNRSFYIGAEELSYSVGPLVILLALAGGWLRREQLRQWSRVRKLAAIVLLCLPIAVNTYYPLYNTWLAALPYFAQVTSVLRWNLIYLLPLILLAGAGFEWLLSHSRGRQGLLAAGLMIILIAGQWLFSGADRIPQTYNPGPVVSAYTQLSNSGDVPQVRYVEESLVDGKRLSVTGSGDSLIRGASQLVCNEPLLGYRLELFRFDKVVQGGVFARRDGAFNFYRPECLQFPDANQCAPGDRFSYEAAAGLRALTSYQRYDFPLPWWQQLANRISLLALLGVMLLAVNLGWQRLR
ncbi:MAG: hypothetical protein KDI36_11345 [Pseudomonadales bacterium]|nr:hypothetical protein [Pseudomonadales bacterium]